MIDKATEGSALGPNSINSMSPPAYDQHAPEVYHSADKTPLVSPSITDEGDSGMTYAPTTSTPRPGGNIAYNTQPYASSTSTSFTRLPSDEAPYTHFKPIYVVALGKNLDKGFAHAPPPSQARPHPFTTHDVIEEDWISFLNAIHTAANLTEKDIQLSRSIPILSITPIVSAVTEASIQAILKGRKGGKVTKVIDTWNHYFFEPRSMRVILMKGQAKLSGVTDLKVASKYADRPSNAPPTVTNDDNVYRLFIVPI